MKALLCLSAGILALTATAAPARTILFVGNSFTMGAGSMAGIYRTGTVHDINLLNEHGRGVGGDAALFKEMTEEVGLDYDVSIEAVGNKNLDFHFEEKHHQLDRPWDEVVLQSYSQLDRDKPGDPSLVIEYSQKLDRMFHAQNPNVKVWFQATWSRADYSSPEIAPWKGKPIDQMAKDVYAGYEKAQAASPDVAGIIPVGLAWNRAWATGVADSDPTHGTAPGKLDLWARDLQHGSSAGYLLAAFVIFGQLTGHDPLSLGDREHAAMDLGLSPQQAHALEQVAHDELAAHGVTFGG